LENVGTELDYIGRPGWRLFDRRCFGYLAAVYDGRPLIASFDRAKAFPTRSRAEEVAEELEPWRWAPVDAPQPPQVEQVALRR
ncbi:MAG: hypothetical protein JWR83_1901, partial [Aeromicrobium sp.]|nr:hypothetical protein [Aeromicrobium sp.]